MWGGREKWELWDVRVMEVEGSVGREQMAQEEEVDDRK